jgi:type IV pilus assembly protein PilY1
MNTANRSAALRGLAPLLAALALAHAAHATTPLADQPVFSSKDVPGNLALALSVEFPTAVSVAHVDGSYSTTKVYLGYFDPNKCYLYSYSATEANRHFYPAGLATSRACTGTNDAKWSGNYLNWATMQTIDPFRWALTGGYRVVDTASETIIEKGHASGQGGTGNFPNRTTTTDAVIADHTPFAWTDFKMRVQGLGNKLRFTQSGNVDNAATAYDPAATLNVNTTYEVSVRVKVCDTGASAGGLEANCTAYPAGNYKPTGLLQQYANAFRYSAFGYLNDSNIQRDGGVLRARQKFVGPTHPVPTSTPVSNAASEWDENTGVLHLNPDAADATTTNTVFGLAAGTVANSGVINYLNKFGQLGGGANYKTYDPVGELYYAALRYFKNLGNVPEWTDAGTATTATKTTWVDGFPVITQWDDPVQYSCQKNFILGIGDVNTHADKNVPGSGMGGTNEPTRPASLATDPFNAKTATDKVGTLHGIANLGTAENIGGCCNNNSALMAGLAYHANTKDIRPTVAGQAQTVGMQTVQTYWLDILEYQTYKSNNQYYLAAKYGGFKVPNGFDPDTRATDIPQAWWSTSGETVGGQNRPDNYFVASDPAAMVLGLKRAFSKLMSDLQLYSTSFATALPQLAVSGSASYAGKYDAGSWTGEVEANSLSFDAQNNPVQSTQWSFSTKLATQVAGTGWDTNRVMMTWNTATSAGVPFRWASISATQQTSLDTVYRSGSDGSDFLNYLRGDTTYEEGSSSTAATADKVYRARTSLVGDIVGSRVQPVATPSGPYADGTNPGYSAFKLQWSVTTPRPTMLYVGTNAGVLHAINGSLTGTNAGKEVFAYVPGAMFNGATAPGTDGLQARGDPNFTHKAMIDGPVSVFDIDLGRTQGGSGTPTWRTVLVGSYGKGGKGYFAIDVTDPASMTTESVAASKVLWEIHQSQASYADLGHTFGQPVAVRTLKYGWVLIFASGYNNGNGNAYFFVVNPRTGALLEKVQVPVTGSSGSQLGMAHVEAYVLDYTEGIADAAYAGDLKGNLYRLDLTPTSAAYTATHLAEVKNAANVAVPITTRPAVLLHPRLNRRFIAVGTGRLLDTTDITNSNAQLFAAYIDGNGAGFNQPHNTLNPTQPNTLPAGISFPIQMGNLQQHTDLTLPVTMNPLTQMGWWVDLGLATNGNGWRVIRDPSTFNGMVTFIATLPTPDACNPSGTSRLYSVDVGLGRSELVSRTTDANGVVNTTRLAYNDALPGESISSQSVSVAGKRALIRCSNNGGCDSPQTENPTPPGLRRLNWRELQLAD